jgi:hypothetical protein
MKPPAARLVSQFPPGPAFLITLRAGPGGSLELGETYRTVQRVELPGGYRDLEFDES